MRYIIASHVRVSIPPHRKSAFSPLGLPIIAIASAHHLIALRQHHRVPPQHHLELHLSGTAIFYNIASCQKQHGSHTHEPNHMRTMHKFIVHTNVYIQLCAPPTCVPRLAHKRLNSEFWGAHIALYIRMVEFGLTYIFCIINNGFRPWYPVKTTAF